MSITVLQVSFLQHRMNLLILLVLLGSSIVLADDATKQKAIQFLDRYKQAVRAKNRRAFYNILHEKFKLFGCEYTTKFATDYMDRDAFWDKLKSFIEPVVAVNIIKVNEAKAYQDNTVMVKTEIDGIKADFEIKVDGPQWYLYKEWNRNCAQQGVLTTIVVNYKYMVKRLAISVLAQLVWGINRRKRDHMAEWIYDPYTLYYCDSFGMFHTKKWRLDGYDLTLPSTHADPEHATYKVDIRNAMIWPNDSITFSAHGSGFNNYFMANRDDGANWKNYKLKFDMNLTCGSAEPELDVRKIQYAVFDDNEMAHIGDLWSIEKVRVCLKRIVHPEVLPSISQEEFQQFGGIFLFEGDEKLINFLKFMYKKSNNKLELYGTIEEMLDNFKKINKIPEFLQFSPNKDEQVSNLCALSTPCMSHHDTSDKRIYSSRSNIALSIFKDSMCAVKSWNLNEISRFFFTSWITAHLNNISLRLRGSYELLPIDSRDALAKELKKFFDNKEINVKVSKNPVTSQHFRNLGVYFDKEVDFNDIFCALKDELIASDPQYFQIAYSESIHLLENLKRIFEAHKSLFTPHSKLPNQKPVLRRVFCNYFEFYLAQEIKNAIEDVMKEPLPEGLMIVESEEERKLGIVHAIYPWQFEAFIEQFGIGEEEFVIVDDPFNEDFRETPYPIISSYGTHCLPAIDAFQNILYYLAVILKVFQRSNDENLKKVFDWIEELISSTFVDKPNLYLIEIWKIDEIIEKARKELSKFLTEPEYEVAFQPIYTKNDVFRELEKLTRNLKWEKQYFLISMDQTINYMLDEPIHFKHVNIGYFQMVGMYLQKNNPKVEQFFKNQSKLMKIGNVADLVPVNTGSFNYNPANFTKIQLYERKPRKEPVEEQLEKLRNSKTHLKKQLKSEIKRLKTVNENAEKDVKKLQKELEKSQKAKTETEKELKSQIKTVTVNFEKRIQSAQEELEKSRKSEAQLEEKMKILEQKNLEEIRNLEEAKAKTEIDVNSLKVELEREKAMNIDLEQETGSVTRDCEELKQQIEHLMSENEKIRAQNSKNANFQEKITEHRFYFKITHDELVDSASSRLMKLCSKYPESKNVKEAKNDVVKLEECIEEYVKNVKMEHKKLREQ